MTAWTRKYLTARAEVLRTYIAEDEARGRFPKALHEELTAIETRLAGVR